MDQNSVKDGSPSSLLKPQPVRDIRPVDFGSGGEVVIRFEDVWKQYRLGVINHGTLASDLQSWWAKLRGFDDPNRPIHPGSHVRKPDSSTDKKKQEWLWALQNISFDVKCGDVLGIVGRNGAGKSTLLKILSKITTPTKGLIRIKGRIASLLEVGTGFHPELTGRENVFLNGAILGMGRQEIQRKLDTIIEFAGIEQFIDTPVKRYSSGMYVRLAFSVAAHLDPDILVIDEVLAVGDTVFQKRCIDKISEVNSQGRTILFVSHNMSLIQALCSKGIVLNDGRISFQGDAREAIDKYIDEGSSEGARIDLRYVKRTQGAQELLFESLEFLNYPIRQGSKIIFKVSLESKEKAREFNELDFGLVICNMERNRLIHCSNRFLDIKINHDDEKSEYFFEIENKLRPGIYYLTLFLRTCEVIQDWLFDAIKFVVEDGNPYDYHDTRQITGSIFVDFDMYKK